MKRGDLLQGMLLPVILSLMFQLNTCVANGSDQVGCPAGQVAQATGNEFQPWKCVASGPSKVGCPAGEVPQATGNEFQPWKCVAKIGCPAGEVAQPTGSLFQPWKCVASGSSQFGCPAGKVAQATGDAFQPWKCVASGSNSGTVKSAGKGTSVTSLKGTSSRGLLPVPSPHLSGSFSLGQSNIGTFINHQGATGGSNQGARCPAGTTLQSIGNAWKCVASGSKK